MNTLPKSLKKLIESFEALPGVGPRSAARLALFVLRAPDYIANNLSDSLKTVKTSIKTCAECYNYADDELCNVCSDPTRNKNNILIVEDALDVLAFERSDIYRGVYHVLGGLLSPINGIGPEEIRVNELLERIKKVSSDAEVIIATNPNLEGESTAMYVKKEIEKINPEIKVSRLARGLPTGADLEYADMTTLQRALEGRVEL